MTTATMTWAKLARRLGTDHNPLRRRSDLIQAWLLPAAIAAFLVLGAPVAFGAIAVTHADNAATRQADRALHPVEAVLLTAAPGPLESARGTNSWLVWTSARWIAAGRPHVGLVPTGSGSRAGAVVRVWLDRAGQVRLPPLTAGQAGDRARAAVGGALAAVAVLLAGLVLFIRRRLVRRRIAAWETDWLSVEPLWSRLE